MDSDWAGRLPVVLVAAAASSAGDGGWDTVTMREGPVGGGGWAGTEKILAFWRPAWPPVGQGASTRVVGLDMVMRRAGVAGGRLGRH